MSHGPKKRAAGPDRDFVGEGLELLHHPFHVGQDLLGDEAHQVRLDVQVAGLAQRREHQRQERHQGQRRLVGQGRGLLRAAIGEPLLDDA
jgi:hypothetical protein